MNSVSVGNAALPDDVMLLCEVQNTGFYLPLKFWGLHFYIVNLYWL